MDTDKHEFRINSGWARHSVAPSCVPANSRISPPIQPVLIRVHLCSSVVNFSVNRSNSNWSSPTTARLTKAGRCRKSAPASSKSSRRRWRNCFRARRDCTAPAARTPASTRSAWWRILKFPALNSRWPSRRLALAINAWLPEDVRVVSATRREGEISRAV